VTVWMSYISATIDLKMERCLVCWDDVPHPHPSICDCKTTQFHPECQLNFYQHRYRKCPICKATLSPTLRIDLFLPLVETFIQSHVSLDTVQHTIEHDLDHPDSISYFPYERERTIQQLLLLLLVEFYDTGQHGEVYFTQRNNHSYSFSTSVRIHPMCSSSTTTYTECTRIDVTHLSVRLYSGTVECVIDILWPQV
jgi:hypothetical protein